MVRSREVLLHEGRVHLPKRYYYQLPSHATTLWLKQQDNRLILSPLEGDSVAMFKKQPEGIYLCIPTDFCEGIAAFNGDMLRIELQESPNRAPQIIISVIIGEITPELLAGALQEYQKAPVAANPFLAAQKGKNKGNI